VQVMTGKILFMSRFLCATCYINLFNVCYKEKNKRFYLSGK